tara:strand:+ start:159 stop:890 length:732 start_codon:yes stop_codon:yes gene_type:complete
MEVNKVNDYFNSLKVVNHYESAARRIGLWDSEEKIFKKIFKSEDSILELGCGAGRISIGLYEIGYKNILATDYANNMVLKARILSKLLGYSIPYRVCDARDLEFEDDIFEGVIFGFNGLMQIPKNKFRTEAIYEIYRVLKKGGFFVFTSHLRSFSKNKSFWEKEAELWSENKQNPLLDEFGDRYEINEMGKMFIHVPDEDQLEMTLKEVGFTVEIKVLRSLLSKESAIVREFSDDCVFWILRK